MQRPGDPDYEYEQAEELRRLKMEKLMEEFEEWEKQWEDKDEGE